MRVSALFIRYVPNELDYPCLMAWAIFIFMANQRNLKATVYGGSTLVTKVVQVLLSSETNQS